MNKTVVFPTRQKGLAVQMLNYLVEGFRLLNFNITYSNKLKCVYDNRHFGGLMPIKITLEDKEYYIWYDSGDKKQPFDIRLKENEFYFKVQYTEEVSKLYNYFFGVQHPNKPLIFLHLLSKLRKLKKQKKYKYDIIAIMNDSNNVVRIKMVDLIRKQKSWKSLSGIQLCKFNKIDVPKGLLINKFEFSKYLELVAQTKICVGLPGNSPRKKPYKDGHNKRMPEILGIGACWLNIESKMPTPGSIDKCKITVKQDLSDFVDKVNYYLEHSKEREKIASNGLKYYEKYLSPKAQVKIIIKTIKERSK